MILRTPAVYTVTDLNDLCEGLCYVVQGCQDWTFWTLSFLWPRQISKSAEIISASLGNLRKPAHRELLQICCNVLFIYSHWSLLCILPFQRNKSSMCNFEIWADSYLFDMLCHLSERMKWIYSWCCMVLSFEFLYSGFVNIVCYVTWTAFRHSFHKIISMSAILTLMFWCCSLEIKLLTYFKVTFCT